jgi:signal transduction histidine kinase
VSARGRRLVPALVLLAGAAALLAGILTLERIFVRERDTALAGLSARRVALELYARQALDDALAARLSAADKAIEAARRDPLAPAREILLIEDGRQVLPRRFTAVPAGGAPARALRESLRDGRSPAPDDSPFSERLALYGRLRSALSRRDAASIEDSFRRFLGHRMLHVLPASQDLPLALAAIESLVAESRPRPDLLSGLLRDGLADGRGARMEGLQRVVLSKRERLTAEDFSYLAERIRRISEASRVPFDDFAARSAEASAGLVEVPSELHEPALVEGGRWYVEPRPDGSVRGVFVHVPDVLAEIASEMRRRRLLGSEARLRLITASVLPTALAGVRVESPAFAEEGAEVRRNQRVKAAWGIACGVLTALLVALGVLWVRQERRYLDVKSDFVATVSHELRTPLASVRLLAETLERRLAPAAGDYPSRIVRDVDRLGFLVENILSFNRISRGRVRPQLADVNLGEVLDGVHRDRGEGRGVLLSSKGTADAWLKGDPELLQLLFSNLYENACRYASRRPIRISVCVEARGDELDVLFADNGDGIPAGEERRVFEEFYRASRADGRGRKGSGLGLAICRRVLALHGGSLEVVKSSPEGTTFGMRFPR